MIGPYRVGAAASVVTLAEAKAHCRVDYDDDDTLMTGLVAAATDHVSQMTGLVLGSETWRVQVGRQSGSLRLPLAPVSALTAVTWLDADEVEQTGDPDDFILFADPMRPWLRPVTGTQWPDVAAREDAITLTFSAGFSSLPPALRSAILLMTGHLYANREAVSDKPMSEPPLAIPALVEAYKRQWVAA